MGFLLRKFKMTNKKLKNKIKSMIDFEAVKELNMIIENNYSDYKQEMWLGKNYAKKYKKGKFDFAKAQKGVKNLIVVPRARKYQNEWGVKIGSSERDAISKARLRAIMRAIREGQYK